MTDLEKIRHAEELAAFYAAFEDRRSQALARRWLARARVLARAMVLRHG